MENKSRAFTLIELLVVVLMMGILAAIAVPQYQLAVEKSRATEALVLLRTIADANKRYYLANGEYSYDITQLDIEISGEDYMWSQMPRRKNTYFSFGTRMNNINDRQGSIAIVNRIPSNADYSYYLVAKEDGTIQCAVNEGGNSSTSMARKICKALHMESL